MPNAEITQIKERTKEQTKTKKALIMSVLSVFLCIAMLIGMTFAWFTDTASTGVNKIQAGNLKVELQYWDGTKWDNAEGKTLNFIKAEGATDEEVLWEPGCTYKLPRLKIVNKGNLALKYKVSVNGVDGDAKLLDAIDFTVQRGTDASAELESWEGALIPDGKTVTAGTNEEVGETAEFTIAGKMRTDAGNEYQNLSFEGIGITVVATQYTYESDSNDNQYDKDANAASTERDLLKALKNGGYVVLKDNVYVQYGVSVPAGKDVTIDLNGKTVTAKENFVTVQTGGKLTISGGTVDAGKYALRSEGGEIVVNGGNYTSKETVGGVVKAGKLTINSGTFTSKDNCVIATNGNIENAGSEIIINGGVFNANIKTSGYIACGVYVANKDTVKINAGTFNVKNGIGVMMRAGNTTIGKNVEINITSDGTITEGKVADAALPIKVGAPLVSDTKSHYPGLDDTFTITNNSKYSITKYE